MQAMDRLIDVTQLAPTDKALAVMRLSLADWLAVGIAGQGEPVAQHLRALALDEGGAGQAALFGGGRAPMRMAALVNGATSHALDYDDTHFAHIGHPSVTVLSAAMAVGERQGASLGAVVEAALRGCEASVRMGLMLGRGHYQIGFHQTATAGAFGAALAAGLLMGLDEARLRQALALVSTRASGLKSQFGTDGKPYNAGVAAANGVEAAWLAAQGMVSNPGALEGVNGFLPTHHADGVWKAPAGWMMEGVSLKFHACCHGLHAALEALGDLLPVDDVDRALVVTHPRWMTVCNQPAPETGLGAKFSYRTALALRMAGHDTAALDSYSDALACDPAVVSLRDKVEVVADGSIAETAARVTVVQGNQTREAAHDLAADLPIDQRAEKLRAKLSALLGDRAEQVWAAVLGDDLGAVVALM